MSHSHTVLRSAHDVLAHIAHSPVTKIEAVFPEDDPTKRHAVAVDCIATQFVCTNAVWMAAAAFISPGSATDDTLFKVTPRGMHLLETRALD